MMTRAVTADRPFDHNIDEKRSIQSMITKKLMLKNRRKILVIISNIKYKQLLLIQIQIKTKLKPLKVYLLLGSLDSQFATILL